MRLAGVVKLLPTLDLNSTIEDAAKIFTTRGIDAVVVLENQTPVGMLSAFEVLEKIVEGANLSLSVKDLMNHNILVIDGDTNPKDAAETMLDHKHWMAVITEKGEYRGVVTAGRLVIALI